MKFECDGAIVEIINPEAIPAAKIAVAKLILKLAERNKNNSTNGNKQKGN